MKSIKEAIESKIIIKNSKFITNIFRINEFSDIEKYLSFIKSKYKDSNHNCYAYIYENQRKSSDDGEPSGTAGIPIINILDKLEVCNVLVVVTRYFGGTLLGSAGLIRAYSSSVKKAIDNSILVDLEKGYNINIIFDYNNVKLIDYLTKDINIINKIFNDNIIYNLNVNNDFLILLNDNNINYIINKEVYIEKEIKDN